MMLKIKDNNRGFTLVEILISMAIISIVLFSLFTIINSSIKQNTKNEKDIKLLNIAQSEIENLRKEIKSSSNNINIYNIYVKDSDPNIPNTYTIKIPDDDEIIWYEKNISEKIYRIDINVNEKYKYFIGSNDDGTPNTSIIEYEREVDGDRYIVNLELLRQQKASKYLYDIKVRVKLKNNHFSKKEIMLESKILSK